MQQNVLGLDVPVNHSAAMRVVERVGDLGRDAHRLLDAELPLAIELLADRLSLDVGHHVVQESPRLTRVEQREDVRVTQRRRRLDLLHEALGAEHRGQLRLEDLDRDVALVLEVAREIHGCHPALAELALDAVAVTQSRQEALGDRCHAPLLTGSPVLIARRPAA